MSPRGKVLWFAAEVILLVLNLLILLAAYTWQNWPFFWYEVATCTALAVLVTFDARRLPRRMHW